MAGGDRPSPVVRRAQRRAMVRHPVLLLSLLVLAALTLLLTLPPSPAQAAPETQWVLTQTLVNPEKAKLEFRGGGSDPEFFGEERFEGMVMIYKPSATSFSIKDRWQDRDYIAWDVTITCKFSAPESTLVPGKPYKLTANFSHSGTLKDIHPGEAFFYYSPEFYFDPDDSLRYYPSDPKTASSMTWKFTAPSASPGATMQIQAGMSNAPACTVIWKYEARAVGPSTTSTTTKPSTTTSSSSTTESSTTTSRTTTADTIPRRWSDAEFEKRVDEMLTRAPATWQGTPVDQGFIGVVIGATGGDDCRIYDYSGRRVPGPASGRWIRLGDTIVTGPNGRVRVELCDRDDARNLGPSVINISRNSEFVFDSFEWERGSWTSLIRGSIRTFFNPWGRDSGFSVRAGGVVCGIRGSDVFIAYDPKAEKVSASVLDGHMDVTSSLTGKTENLTALQSAVVRDGEIGEVHSFSEEQWSIMVKAQGLEDMRPLSPEERAAAWAQVTPTTATPTTATRTTATPTTVPPAGQGSTVAPRPPTFTHDEFIDMQAKVANQVESAPTDFIRRFMMVHGYIGVLTTLTGDWEVYDYNGEPMGGHTQRTVYAPNHTYMAVRIGDTVQTAADGTVRIDLFDWDGESAGAPSVINVGRDTTLVLNEFDSTSKERTWLSLLRGGVRVGFKGLSSDSSFNVGAGGALFGVGGSDVLLLYDPDVKRAEAYVGEGRLDVSSSASARPVSLKDGQRLVIRNGSYGEVEPWSNERWIAVVKAHGLTSMAPLTLQQLKDLGEAGSAAKTWGIVGGAAAALITAVGVGVYLLRRRERRTGGEAASPARVPVAADTGASDPSFCGHCGSAVTPGSTFCQGCGKRL